MKPAKVTLKLIGRADGAFYRVVKTVNSLDPKPGDYLTKTQVEFLLNQAEVTIT